MIKLPVYTAVFALVYLLLSSSVQAGVIRSQATVLTPQKEYEFQIWYRGMANKYNLPANPDGQGIDYRAAWSDGVYSPGTTGSAFRKYRLTNPDVAAPATIYNRPLGEADDSPATEGMAVTAMTKDQVSALPGVEMLGGSALEILNAYGMPRAFCDHGITAGRARHKIVWTMYRLPLTWGDWNLIYKSSTDDIRGDKRYVMYPGFKSPRQFSPFEGICFYSSGDVTGEYRVEIMKTLLKDKGRYKDIFSRKFMELTYEEQQKLIMGTSPEIAARFDKLSANQKLDLVIFDIRREIRSTDKKGKQRPGYDEAGPILSSHYIQEIRAVYKDTVPLTDITSRFGENYAKTVDEDKNPVYRYWAELTSPGSNSGGLRKIVVIDFSMVPGGVTGYHLRYRYESMK